MNLWVFFSDFSFDALNLVFVLDVSNKTLPVAHQFGQRLAPLRATHNVNDVRTNFFERFSDMPRDTFFVGHAKHNNCFASELEKVHVDSELAN